MYPKNAAFPEPIAIGAVVQISDGVVQTSGCTVRIKPIGVAEGDGAGTTAYSTDGIVLYTPTQGETNYTSFILIAKKTGCIPVSITVVTTESAVAGRVSVGMLAGVVQSLTDLKDFADDGYDPSTNKVQGVVLVDTMAGTIQTLDALDTAQDSQHGTTQTAIATVDTVVDAILVDTAEIGAAGAGLTALAQSSSWTGTLAANLATTNSTVATNLNATITSRMATYAQPTGFLAATFPGTVASTTNITAASGVTLSSAGNTAVATAVEAAILDEGDATALLAAIAAKVEEFLVNEGDATATIAAIATACNAAIAAGTVGTNVTAIKAKTDNLPASPASSTNVTDARDAIIAQVDANEAKIDILDTILDAHVALWTSTVAGRIDVAVSSRSSHTAANVLSALGTGTWATAIPWNAAWDAEVQSEVQDAIEVNHLDHLLAADYDPASKPGVSTALLNEIIGNDAGVSQFTANALELGPGGGGGGDATEAKQDTIIALIGTPIDTDIATDIANVQTAVDAINVGAGSGARTVTITVNDGATVLENARVRLTEGANTYAGLTNASGVIVFSVDDATYSVRVTKTGYQFTPTTLVVDGDESQTYSMTATVVTPATDPAHSTLAITCYDEYLELEAGAVLRLTMTRIPTDDVGRSFDSKTRVLTADSSGYIEATVARLAEYTIERGDSYPYKVRVDIPDSDTCTVESVLGKEVL